jgi:hypothetical protein
MIRELDFEPEYLKANVRMPVLDQAIVIYDLVRTRGYDRVVVDPVGTGAALIELLRAEGIAVRERRAT